jgi:NADPH-dependent 7-cyano-7-deazaguanine reductase QueF-like protein
MWDDKYISCIAHANIPNVTTEKIEMVFIVVYCVISKCFKLSTNKQCYFVYLKTQILTKSQSL